MKHRMGVLVLAVVALASIVPTVASAATGSRVVRDVTTASGRHLWTQELLDRLPVYGAYTFTNAGPGPRLTVQRSFAQRPVALSGRFALGGSAVRAIALRHTGAPAGSRATATRVAFPKGTAARRAWDVRVVFATEPGDWSVVVDAENGAVLRAHDDVQRATGSGNVFSPNPVVSLGNPNLTDQNDIDGAVPAGAYVKVKLRDLDGTGLLRGLWVDATEGSHTASLAMEPSLKYKYQRSDDRFEAVMSYYWLEESQRYIRSLGFTGATGINDDPQDIRVDDFTGDNSFYSPSADTITYGIGGVDDAEDAEVILHEYGHAIQDAESPGWGQTLESASMGEGFGDYWAGDQTADASIGQGLLCIAEWDSTSYASVPSCLRRLDSTKHYPESVAGEPHADGEMWSASLWQVRTKVGRTVANTLILESHFLLNPTSTFADGATAILAADDDLYAGAHKSKIKKIFKQRGLLT